MAAMTPTDATTLADALYRALAAWDTDALDALLSPDFTGTTAEGLPLGLGGRYDGAPHMRDAFWRRIGGAFEVRAEPDAVVPLADGGLLVTGRYRGRARRSGGVLDAAFSHVISVEDGRITSLAQTTDTQRWHEALAGPASTTVPPTPAAEPPPAARRAPADRPFEHRGIDYRVSAGLATIHLSRPDAGNAFDLAVATGLDDAAGRVADDPAVRAVLITAACPNFNVGGDITVFAGAPEGGLGATLRTLTDPFHNALARLAEVDAPVVAAVHGAAAGGGLALVCCADIVIAGESSRFVSAYDRLGLTADGGVTWFLPRLLGLRRAQAFMLSGRPWTADEALDAGLVTAVVPDDEVDATALAQAQRLAEGPTGALGHVRRMLRDSGTRSLRDQLAVEQTNLSAVADGPDATAGIAAFAARTAATFVGR